MERDPLLVYSEYSLVCYNLFTKNVGINKFDGLTGYSLILVHYIDTGKLWQIKRFGG